VKKVADYLSHFADTYYEINSETRDWIIEIGVIPKGDFLTEIDGLTRISLGEIHTENRLLGSEFLNYSNRTEAVRNDLVIIIKAESQKSIVDTIKDIYSKFTGADSVIQKIRVKGLTNSGTDVVLDTEIIKKIHHIDAEINETDGIIRSNQFLSELAAIVVEY
jgi:hypothetical protein